MARPTQDEIDDLLSWCLEAMDDGSRYPGMSQGAGVQDAIRWMRGEGERPDRDD
jgi:hypothetical protein